MSRTFFLSVAAILLFPPASLLAQEPGRIDVYQDLEVPGQPSRFGREQTLGVTKINKDALDLVAQGKFDQAIILYHAIAKRIEQKKVEDKNFAAEVLNNLAVAYYERGREPFFRFNKQEDLLAAADFAQKSLEIKPDYGPAYETLAKVYQWRKDLENAAQLYALAVQYSDPQSKDYKRLLKRYQVILSLLEKKRRQSQF